jgi:4,5-dihydroxyphthalate decarboxylase
MSKLPLTFACGLYDRMLALYTGEVAVEGVDLNFLVDDNPRNIFDRMAGGLEFDVSEFSSSEYISRFAAGQCPFVAIPVFASRVFRHSFIFVNRKHIKTPKDLAGKRIGVPIYAMTAAIVIRGLLQHDYGVDLSGVTWVEGGMNDTKPHGAPGKIPLVREVNVELYTDKMSLNDRLESGDVAAVIGSALPKAVKTNPNIGRLFPDYHRAEVEYYRKTKNFPIMHLVVLKRELYEKHPFLATSLYNACCEAKAIAHKKMRELGTLRYMLPWMAAELEEIEDVFGGNPWPYGIEDNRPSLTALVQYLADQALIEKPVPIESLFAPIFGQAAKP